MALTLVPDSIDVHSHGMAWDRSACAAIHAAAANTAAVLQDKEATHLDAAGIIIAGNPAELPPRRTGPQTSAREPNTENDWLFYLASLAMTA